MIGKVLFVVDGSVPPEEAATLAHGLLPRVSEVLVLQVVPQLPYAWTAWPAFPDPGEDLAKAAAYVSGVAGQLQARGWTASTKVYFSPLGAAEMDREVLKLAASLGPDMLCLAMARGKVRAGIVREATVPLLVAKSPSSDNGRPGPGERSRPARQPAPVHRRLFLNPAAALIFRRAGLL